MFLFLQRFKSLFELIEHKLDTHQQKIRNTSRNSGSLNLPSTSKQLRGEYMVDSNRPAHLPQQREISVAKKGIKKTFHCIYCAFCGNTKKELNDHEQLNHSDQPCNPSVFECSTCGKTFKSRPNLIKHLVVHR